MIFRDRDEAGRKLALELMRWRDRRPVVLALPRGGLPVAAEIARALGAPLDLLMVRKISAPWQPELAIGALAGGPAPTVVWNDDVLAMMGVSPAQQEQLLQTAAAELSRRRDLYLRGREPAPLQGRTAILVDDGAATGATMTAAVRAARAAGADRVVLGLPVAAREALQTLRAEADDVVCLQAPADFPGVGAFYEAFPQLSDGEVAQILGQFPPRKPAGASKSDMGTS